jgi:hypothetical protein
MDGHDGIKENWKVGQTKGGAERGCRNGAKDLAAKERRERKSPTGLSIMARRWGQENKRKDGKDEKI